MKLTTSSEIAPMKGGGKNFVVSFMYCYIVYKLLCMRNPHDFFNHNPSKPLTLLNVAVNADTAKENFFNFVSTTIKAAGPKAFIEHGFNPEKHMGSTEIRFPKNILIKSGHSKAGGMEGYDVLIGVVDEVDAAEFSGVSGIYQTLPTSASTRFGNKRKTVTISFRRYVGSNGMIKKLYAQYKEREERVKDAYARRYASWEFNHRPGLRESLEPEFESNPEMARCLYLSADDDGYSDSWIKDTKRIKTSMTKGGSWIFDMPVPEEDWKVRKSAEYSWENRGTIVELNPYDLPIKHRGIPGVKYVLTGDPGLGSVAGGGDAYGLTLAHRELVKGEDGHFYPRPVIDFAFRFTGRMFKEGEVQMEAVHQLIEKLNRYGYDIAIYSFDGWNDAATVQWIARNFKGKIIYTKNLVETRDYTALRDAIFSESPPSIEGEKAVGGGISWFYHPVLYDELIELRVDREKGKVDHTELSSKDMADTVAKAVRIITLQWPIAEVASAGAPAPGSATSNSVLAGQFSAKSMTAPKKKIVIPRR